LKELGKWREAWTLVAASIVAAHVGDRLMALRKKAKAPQHLLQHDDETVAATKQVYLTASTRNAQAKPVMGKLPACILGVLGRAPAGQSFQAKFGVHGALGATAEVLARATYAERSSRRLNAFRAQAQ
jgi:hypothetical protein